MENDQLKAKLEALEITDTRLNTIASDSKSEKGSSLARVRRTAQQRTEEWHRKHGVFELGNSSTFAVARRISLNGLRSYSQRHRG